MSAILVVVNSVKRWDMQIPGVSIVSANQYLTDSSFAELKNARVYNLCRSYRYQTSGYYVSLLAEARGHKPLPLIGTIQDLKTQAVIRVLSVELDQLIQKSFKHLQSETFSLSIYFSRNLARRYDQLCRSLFNLFPIPLQRVFFRKIENRWVIVNICPISMNEIPQTHRQSVQTMATEYFARRNHVSDRRRPPRNYLAILTDPSDNTPPSDEKALLRFERTARKYGLAVERITNEDYGRVGEFDALFIRETTAVNNPTFRFANRAEAEGLVVIDDPVSILRCTNKVYLAELFKRHKVPCPRTELLHRDNLEEVPQRLGLPCVIKAPDSSFSKGVCKAASLEEYCEIAERLLQKSDLLIAQEFLPSAFDWRIGILEQRSFYACKYFMARGHWQIYNSARNGRGSQGTFETLPIEMVPSAVVRAAEKAARPIGRGLYGVDVKYLNGKAYVIEVNDNPSLEAGVEDKLLKHRLYEQIIEAFIRRLDWTAERNHRYG